MKNKTLQRTLFNVGWVGVLSIGLFLGACRNPEPKTFGEEEQQQDSFEDLSTTSAEQQDTTWDTEGDSTTTDTSTEQQEQPEPSRSSLLATHEVAPGENLWGIAKQYYGNGIYWRAIRDENGMQNPDQLKAGQKLDIPRLSDQRKQEIRQQAAREGSSAPVASKGSGSPQTGTYVTKEGDTFWKIAQEVYGNGKKWKRIWNANKNKIPDPDDLKAGTKIRIPGAGSGATGKGSPSKGQVQKGSDVQKGQ